MCRLNGLFPPVRHPGGLTGGSRSAPCPVTTSGRTTSGYVTARLWPTIRGYLCSGRLPADVELTVCSGGCLSLALCCKAPEVVVERSSKMKLLGDTHPAAAAGASAGRVHRAAAQSARRAGTMGTVNAADVVTVQHLVKRYGPLLAVNDVSLSIREGEIFGIIGPNGAGKTTTVECISGLRAPDAGSISVYGLSPQRDRNKIREVEGVQLQQSALPPRLRAREAAT